MLEKFFVTVLFSTPSPRTVPLRFADFWGKGTGRADSKNFRVLVLQRIGVRAGMSESFWKLPTHCDKLSDRFTL
jgi:hypothetical protein